MVDSTIRKVQALLNKAASTEFAEERDTFLAAADKLMAKYSIDQFMLDQAAGDSSMVTHAELVAVGDQARGILEMMYTLTVLVGAKGIFTSTGNGYGRPGEWRMEVFGFKADLEYLERLYATLQIAILRHIEPEVDPTLSYDENVWRLHEAGLVWRKIAEAMNAARLDENGEERWEATPWPDGGRLIRAYRRACKAMGVEPHAVTSAKGYRSSFVYGFHGEVAKRINDSRAEFAKEAQGTGQELVLADKKGMVDKAFAEAHPSTGSLRREDRRMDSEGFQKGRKAGRNVDIGSTRMPNSKKALS